MFGLVRKKAKGQNKFLIGLLAVDGFVPSAVLALVHFIVIVIVPFLTPIITFLAVCEMTTF